MKKHIEILTLGLLITASSSMATTIVTFASGQASVPLPSSYRVTTGDDGLVATFGKGGKHKLEISLTGLLSADRHENDLGAKFVLDQASKRNIKASSTPGRAVLMEPGGDTQVDATTYRSVHWQIGAANCVFTMTVTAPVPLSSDLDDFLDGPLNDIVNNLGCKKL